MLRAPPSGIANFFFTRTVKLWKGGGGGRMEMDGKEF